MRPRTIPLDSLDATTISTILERQANEDLQEIAKYVGVPRRRTKRDQIMELVSRPDCRFFERFQFEVRLAPKAGVFFDQMELDIGC